MMQKRTRMPSVLTILALIGFSLACGGMDVSEENIVIDEPPAEVEYEPGDAGDEEANRLADAANFNAFEQSDLSFCDAKLLGQMWDSDTYEAKLMLGYKIKNGLAPQLEELLTDSRTHAREAPDLRKCSFGEMGYSDDTAAQLARLWGVTADEARAQAEDKMLLGNGSLMREAVASAAELDAAELEGDAAEEAEPAPRMKRGGRRKGSKIGRLKRGG